MLKCFVSSLVEKEEVPFYDEVNDGGIIHRVFVRGRGKVTKYPLFVGQIGMLFKLNPAKYQGYLTDDLLSFLAENFRDNLVFIVDNEGFLLYIMIMQTNKAERKLINQYYVENLDRLEKYQLMNTEYQADLEEFMLLDARLKPYEKTEDVVLTYF
jgi:hypothetical protein